MTKTADYEIIDYGIHNYQYFQGHGTAFTSYEHATLGSGDTYQEALENALDAAAQYGFELELAPEDEPEQFKGKGPSASDEFDKACETEGEDPEHCECELTYYVGIRWN